jgi:CheY-like chemotaxis protein
LRVRLPRPKGAVGIALSPEPEKIDDFENPAANLLGGVRTVLAIGQPAAIEDITAIAIPGSSLVLHTRHQTHVLHVDLSAGAPGSTRVLVDIIPPAQQDWSQLDTLIVGLSGWFDATVGAAKLPRVKVTLTDPGECLGVGQYVMLAVSDTGIGMSKEVIASAFDPFFTTKEIGQGTGLRLSQVYGFVKQSGGHVKIYSELGEGTTVRTYLPRLVDAADVEEEIPVSRMPSGDGSEIILLVEDDEAVRDLNAAMLRELNYAVIEAEDGPRALQILDVVPNICVLFTDVGLPGAMNGRQLAETALQRRPDLRVLFTTGYARNAIVHHGRLDPGINLLSKPFTAAALTTKIRDLIDRS